MSFPKQVNLYPGVGVAGDVASENPVVHTAQNYISEGTVTVGNFVFLGSTQGQAKASGAGKPLGIVRRVLQYPNNNVLSESMMTLAQGSPLTILKKADVFVTSQTTAAVGQKVFASTTDGSIKTGAASATISGFVETDFTVITAGAVGEVIIVSSWA